MQVLAAVWPELATSIAGVSTMKQASFALADSSAPAISGRTRSKSPFALLLEALHISRRLQAQRCLWQYRHLIAANTEAKSNIAPSSD
jgi:hypothetical protein